MGLNHLSIAAMIALLGAAPVLHAETAAQPASPAAPASDPALQASPLPGTAPAATPEATPSAVPPAPAPATTAPVQTKGDVLTVPKQKPAAAKKKKASSTPIRIVEDGMPGRGASMSQVEKHFGQPREKVAPVGQPPITRWIYGDYTVYFEHEYVIHSVRNDGSAQPTAPAQPAPAQPAPQQPMAPAMEAAPAPAEPATQPAVPVMEPAAPAMPEPAAPPAAAPASGQ
jgi:hypothetical protein